MRAAVVMRDGCSGAERGEDDGGDAGDHDRETDEDSTDRPVSTCISAILCNEPTKGNHTHACASRRLKGGRFWLMSV
jgi:hypothetical protein